MNEILYAAKQTTCKWEYSPVIVSVHRTLEGAEKAIAELKEKAKADFLELKEWDREFNSDFNEEDWAWDEESGGFNYCKWCISEIEVKD